MYHPANSTDMDSSLRLSYKVLTADMSLLTD